jgi:hypothetical protein
VEGGCNTIDANEETELMKRLSAVSYRLSAMLGRRQRTEQVTVMEPETRRSRDGFFLHHPSTFGKNNLLERRPLAPQI